MFASSDKPRVEVPAWQPPDMARLYPTDPWAKIMFKAPLALWRMGLGPLMGRLMMVTTTTGRQSGLPRRVMTEYQVLEGKKVVPCAFGERAQWYKNIQADPHVTIQTSQGTESVIARRVTDDEELLAIYNMGLRRNPVMLKWYLSSLGIDPEDPDHLLANKAKVYFITFDPTDDPTPPPLEADLVWIWPLAFVIWLLWRLLTPRRKS